MITNISFLEINPPTSEVLIHACTVPYVNITIIIVVYIDLLSPLVINISNFVIDIINAYFMSFIWLAWFGIAVLVSVYYSLLWHATTLVSFIYTWSLLLTKRYWLLYSNWSTLYLIRALIPYHSHLLLLLNHVGIVVKLCCAEGLMEDRCTSNKHSS